MRHQLPLNALRAFEAAARRLSFSAAAAEMCVTHSAVSHQVRQLEDWLGHKLFVRHAGGVRLTDAGQTLWQATGQALAQLEACCAQIGNREAQTEIALGAPGSLLANWLIPRLERFEAAHPELRIRLQTCASIRELEKQRVDALIVAGRAPWPRAFATTALFDEAIGPVCTAAAAARIERPRDLAGQPLLHTASRPDAWKDWAVAQGLDSAAFASGRRFDHLPLLLEAAAAGLGVAIAPALLVEREIARGRLTAPLGFAPCGSSFTLCIGAGRAREAAFASLREWLQDEALRE